MLSNSQNLTSLPGSLDTGFELQMDYRCRPTRARCCHLLDGLEMNLRVGSGIYTTVFQYFQCKYST